MTRLTTFAQKYLDSRAVSDVYAANITRRAAALERFAASDSIREILQEPVVNKFLKALTCKPVTIRSYRSDYLALWNAAADYDLVPYPVARRIVCPAVPTPLVDCYDIAEAQALLVAAGKLIGKYRHGVLKRHYWSAAIRLAWDAGFRRGDIWLFRRDSVRADGTLRIVQHKTGQVVTVRLRASTVLALDAIQDNQPLRWPIGGTYFGRHFRAITKAAGVSRGSFKWLRRSSGSYVEMAQPGAGHKHLGHATPQMFDRHYDAKLGGHALPQPPEL